MVVNLNPQNGMLVSRLDITSLTGGLSTSLDSIYIAQYPEKAILQIQVSGPPNPVSLAQKVASTAIADGISIIRPPDYNAITNPYQWYIIA